jgi:hypothetical protein
MYISQFSPKDDWQGYRNRYDIIVRPSVKGGSVEERLYKKLQSTANLNFLFLSLFVYLLKTVLLSFSVTRSQLSQCFAVRNWVVCLTKTKTKAYLTLSFWEGKFKFAVLWCLSIKPFFQCTVHTWIHYCMGHKKSDMLKLWDTSIKSRVSVFYTNSNQVPRVFRFIFNYLDLILGQIW